MVDILQIDDLGSASLGQSFLLLQPHEERRAAGMDTSSLAEDSRGRLASIEAARQRFRPIVMTSLACIPLALASVAGANSQHDIGIGIIGGMLASTLVASLFVPLFFVLLEEASQRVRALARAGPRSPLPAHGPRDR